MKKILYILFMVSLLAASCTQEVLVSRDHDLDAEVLDITTTMDMSVLYCNINDVADETLLDLQKVGDYLAGKGADVVTLVAPAKVNGTDFATWLATYAEANGLKAVSAKNVDGRLCMGALVAGDYVVENYVVEQGLTFSNAVLHFQTTGIHFVVTDIKESRNAVPSNWEEQVEAMTTNKKAAAIVYDPDNLASRKVEVDELIARTKEYKDANGIRPFANDKNWLWCVDMNVASYLDMKYGIEFARKDCYDYDEWTEAFFTTVTDYFSVSELLPTTDPYFALNESMLKNAGVVDCVAVQYSVYTPSSISLDGNPTKERNNFLYSSNGCWNMFEKLTLDTAAVSELGTTHYPIMVTLKSEE